MNISLHKLLEAEAAEEAERAPEAARSRRTEQLKAKSSPQKKKETAEDEPSAESAPRSGGKYCSACKERIEGRFLNVKGRFFHPEHFRCPVCACKLQGQPFIEKDGLLLCKTDYYLSLKLVCGHCREAITGDHLSVCGKVWHKDHFLCTTCSTPLTGTSWKKLNDMPYCRDHYMKTAGKMCNACEKPIEGVVFTHGEEPYHPDCFVCAQGIHPINGPFCKKNGKIYCKAHHDSLFLQKCGGCLQVLQPGTKFLTLLGNPMHHECWQCNKCKKAINAGNCSFYKNLFYCHVCVVKVAKKHKEKKSKKGSFEGIPVEEEEILVGLRAVEDAENKRRAKEMSDVDQDELSRALVESTALAQQQAAVAKQKAAKEETKEASPTAIERSPRSPVAPTAAQQKWGEIEPMSEEDEEEAKEEKKHDDVAEKGPRPKASSSQGGLPATLMMGSPGGSRRPNMPKRAPPRPRPDMPRRSAPAGPASPASPPPPTSLTAAAIKQRDRKEAPKPAAGGEPETAGGEPETRAGLEAAMKRAVAAEDYDECARLRDRIAALPPAGTNPKASSRPQVCEGNGGRYDKSKDLTVIVQLVHFMAQPEHVSYVSEICDAPFRSTLHKPSVERLDDLWMKKRGKLTFSDVPPVLRDQLPNLLKQYVNDTNYRFGLDPTVDGHMATICRGIIDAGLSFSNLGAMSAGFPPLAAIEYAFKKNNSS